MSSFTTAVLPQNTKDVWQMGGGGLLARKTEQKEGERDSSSLDDSWI